MRIFDSSNSPWAGKFNVVDENNVYLGFDFQASCCEDFGYFFSTKQPEHSDDRRFVVEESQLTQEKFTFDPSFFCELDDKSTSESGGACCFKLTAKNEELFLTIFNHHNGYYSHGFVFKNNEVVLQEGNL